MTIRLAYYFSVAVSSYKPKTYTIVLRLLWTELVNLLLLGVSFLNDFLTRIKVFICNAHVFHIH